MECTQKLDDLTQHSYAAYSERTCPDQIGILGICGTKYPVKRGPNKIGRDPSICNIVLNLNSVSRQHAVINVLNNREYMLMDLDSANKTRLNGKILLPYIPNALTNCDTVQFGDVFGVFRLIEEDNDLPMTQALDVPDTPVFSRNPSKLKTLITMIPESPDVSDKEESFIIASQQKPEDKFKSPKINFIKPSGKTVCIQQIGSKKIDNVFWNSSKKSSSINLDDSSNSLNESMLNNIEHESIQNKLINKSCNNNIHEMETQVDNKLSDSPNSIYNENTQNIYVAETQDTTIHVAMTQFIPALAPIAMNDPITEQPDLKIHTSIDPSFELKENNKEIRASDEEILFEGIDSRSFDDNFESQPIQLNDVNEKLIASKGEYNHENVVTNKNIIDSDFNSLLTQKLPTDITDDDQITDCEDECIPPQTLNNCDDTDCEDELFVNSPKSQLKNDTPFDELATQILRNDDIKNSLNISTDKSNFEELSTQIIISDDLNEAGEKNYKLLNEITIKADNKSNLSVNNMDSPFKKPFLSPSKQKKKDSEDKNKTSNELENYYDQTQNILDDLLTQTDDAIVPCSVENFDPGDKYPYIEIDSSPTKKKFIAYTSISKQKSCDSSDFENTPKKSFKIMDIDLPSSQEIKTSVALHTKTLTSISSSDSENENLSEECTPILFKKKKSRSKIDAKIDLTKRFEAEALPARVITRVRKPTAKLLESGKNQKSAKNILEGFFLPNHESEIDAEIITENLLRLKNKVERSKNKKTTLANNVKNKPNNLTKDKKNNSIEELGNKNDENNPNNLTKDKKNCSLKESDTKNVEKLENKNISKIKKKKHVIAPLITETHSNVNLSKELDASELKTAAIDHDNNSKKDIKLQNKRRNNKIKIKLVQKETESKQDYTTGDTILSSKKNQEKIKTRTRNKEKIEPQEIQTIEKKSKKPELHSKEFTNKSSENKEASKRNNRNKRHAHIESSPEPEKEIRRSKRQKTVLAKTEIEKPNLQIDSKKPAIHHEQSTIYNVSSGSGSDISKNLKRNASDIINSTSKPKRSRSSLGSNLSLRSTPARINGNHKILFTAFPNNVFEEVKHKLCKLGATLETDIKACTVLVTVQIKRTFKLLCAVGLGKPIVGPNWVQACVDTNVLVDPWLYLIKDETAEKRFHFNLRTTLVGKRNFLKGYNVSSTSKVMPNATEMKLIVESSGGTWKEGGSNWLCVSCSADRNCWSAMKRKGATVVSTELILGGVLKQTLDIAGNKLG